MATYADPSPRHVEPYRVPALLQDIRLLDLLELSGSTVQASELLSLSQPTVSRRYRSLAQDFGLERDPRQRKLCRYGSTDAMRWLRMGCRAHRLEAGYARIGADLMHQPLLSGMDWLLPTPVRFRSIHDWAELIREGVIDAALVTGMEMRSTSKSTGIDLGGLRWIEISEVSLCLGIARQTQLLNRGGETPVLVPPRSTAPELYRALRATGCELRTASEACRNEKRWRTCLNKAHLAAPLYMEVPRAGSWAEELEVIALPIEIKAPLGLLLPQKEYTQGPVEKALQWIRRKQIVPKVHGPTEQARIERPDSGYSERSTDLSICAENQAPTQDCRRV
jgi:DNA-binding transcriptional LysR family regulator